MAPRHYKYLPLGETRIPPPIPVPGKPAFIYDGMAAPKPEAPPKTPKTIKALGLLLSFRQAAKALGVDRGAGLKALIDSKQLSTVVANGKTKVPRSEVERLAAVGFDKDLPKPKSKGSKKGGQGSGR